MAGATPLGDAAAMYASGGGQLSPPWAAASAVAAGPRNDTAATLAGLSPDGSVGRR